MGFVEVCAEVFAQGLADRILQEAEVVDGIAAGEGHPQELSAAGHDVVFKPLAIEHGNDGVFVGLECERFHGLALLLLVGGQVICLAGSGIGEDQAWFVEAVAAHHATHGVGEQLLHGVGAEADPLLRFRELAALAGIAVSGVHREGYLLNGHLGGEFILQAIGINEEAIVLLFQALHLGNGGLVLGDPGVVAGFEGGVGLEGSGQEGQGLEVPGTFVGVPVNLGY